MLGIKDPLAHTTLMESRCSHSQSANLCLGGGVGCFQARNMQSRGLVMNHTVTDGIRQLGSLYICGRSGFMSHISLVMIRVKYNKLLVYLKNLPCTLMMIQLYGKLCINYARKKNPMTCFRNAEAHPASRGFHVETRSPISWLQHDSLEELKECADPMLTPAPSSIHNSTLV